jgi:hypothetical protein
MLKLTKIAIIAATLSLALAGAAEAKKPSHHQAWLDSLKAKGATPEATEVGEAFDPNPEVIDAKGDCIADGGLPKNQIEADGSIGIRCVPIYMLEQ